MVLLALETLRLHPASFDIHHVNARFSSTLEDIGDSSMGKMLLSVKYLTKTIWIRFRIKQPILYYVPGPVKWSSVLRDWLLLAVLRLFYSRVVFHWHAIGHGEWAHGSERLALDGPRWMDRMARKISARVLDAPFASITVSENSRKDSLAVASEKEFVINNGIEDPCPGFEEELLPKRQARQKEIAATAQPCFNILFLSHGTEEKGTLDALDCMIEVLEDSDPSWGFQLTFAGGISEAIRQRFDAAANTLTSRWPGRMRLIEEGYLEGSDKHRRFVANDIFLAPSRWESFGLTVAEAMAFGMQIVATGSDGVSGVLPPEHPYISPVANPPALAKSLLACCGNLRGSLAQEEANALRVRFLTHFQTSRFAENLVNALETLGAGLNRSESATGDRVASASHHPLQPVHVRVYLGDQNPKLGRSLGISRMTEVVLRELSEHGDLELSGIVSRSSIQMPAGTKSIVLPWKTKSRTLRVITDHLHPLLAPASPKPDLWYFPKGFLPRLHYFCQPSVVTIHDTIIQYYSDHYPTWRTETEYRYWASMLKHTLRNATSILTVSHSAKAQIVAFMSRHHIPPKQIDVTYEPCLYECFPQPDNPPKADYVLHLASREPHKRTEWLIREWVGAGKRGMQLPALHVIGSIPQAVESLAAQSDAIVRLPFLEDDALRSQFSTAKALILPSEIEGFGLPAIEAYYLGTPVCYTLGTSIEEVLTVATTHGGFHLDDPASFFAALEDVMRISPGEIHACGLKLRGTYAAQIVAEEMMKAFREARRRFLQAPDSADDLPSPETN